MTTSLADSVTKSVTKSDIRALLIGVDFGKADLNSTDFNSSMEELSLLALSAGVQPISTITCKRATPDSALFVGSGKAEEITHAIIDHDIGIVIFHSKSTVCPGRDFDERRSEVSQRGTASVAT